MIQIPPPVMPAIGYAFDDAADPAAPQSANALYDATVLHRDANPYATLGGLHDLHPGVQAFAYADANGGGGGTTKKAQTPPAPPPIPAPAGSFDVGSATPAKLDPLRHADVSDADLKKLEHRGVDQAEIDKLKASPKPAEQKRGEALEADQLKARTIKRDRLVVSTIEHAKASYADLLAKGAKISVTTSAGNGGQPVMTLCGPGYDPKKPPSVVHTHYHGDNATVGDPQGSKAGTNWRIRQVLDHDKQTVFVLPEARNATAETDAPGHDNYYSVQWQDVASQSQTTDDALKAAGIAGKPGTQVVSFHSGGGKVVQQLMAKDPSGAGLRADRIELHDSLYGTRNVDWKKNKEDPNGWEQPVKKWAATANGQAVKQVIYYHAGNEIERQQVIEKAFGSKYIKHEMSRAGKLDDTTNPVYRDPDGKTYTRTQVWVDAKGTKHVSHPTVRMFDPDSHYRTTGQDLAVDPPLPPDR